MNGSGVDRILERLASEDLGWLHGKRCVVTGGAGFIGSWLVETLVRCGVEVYVVDNLWRGSLENLCNSDGEPFVNLDNHFLCADLREYHVCLSACLKADVVFHLADVVAGIDFVFANEGAVFRSNILINSNVFRAAQETSVKRLIYVGAACSYPKELQAVPGGPPLVEEQAYPASPESAYGWSKLIGEYEAELLMKNTDVQVAILRLHNVYGPRAEFSIQRSQVVPSLIRKAIRFPKEDFVVWGTGRQTRSFIYINDVIEALLRASVKGLNSGPIQIGTSEQVAIREVAETIVRISGKRIPIMFDPKKPEGDGGRSANCDKAKRILGWQAFTPMDVGLELTYQWIQNAIEVRAKAGV